jgi:hypothetical protein
VPEDKQSRRIFVTKHLQKGILTWRRKNSISTRPSGEMFCEHELG